MLIVSILNQHRLFCKIEYQTDTDTDFGRNTNQSVKYWLWIPIIHCIGQIPTKTDTDILTDYRIVSHANTDTDDLPFIQKTQKLFTNG